MKNCPIKAPNVNDALFSFFEGKKKYLQREGTVSDCKDVYESFGWNYAKTYSATNTYIYDIDWTAWKYYGHPSFIDLLEVINTRYNVALEEGYSVFSIFWAEWSAKFNKGLLKKIKTIKTSEASRALRTIYVIWWIRSRQLKLLEHYLKNMEGSDEGQEYIKLEERIVKIIASFLMDEDTDTNINIDFEEMMTKFIKD